MYYSKSLPSHKYEICVTCYRWVYGHISREKSLTARNVSGWYLYLYCSRCSPCHCRPPKFSIFRPKHLSSQFTLVKPASGLHKLWYPSIRDTSTWGKFGAHGEHGDVFLFSNLGALWFSENLIRYSLHVCLREVKNNLFSFKHSYLRHFSWRF